MTNLVTVTGTIEADAIGEPVEVQLEIETGVTTAFDRTSELEITTCVTEDGSEADSCADEEASADLTVDLVATPSLGRLPAPDGAATPDATDEVDATDEADATEETDTPSSELTIDITAAEITDQSFLGEELTIGSTILIESGGADDGAEVVWSVTEQVPAGLVIQDATCVSSAGTSCEVTFDQATNLVTVSGTIEEDAVGEPVEVRLEIETGVTTAFDRTSDLEIQTCVTDAEGGDGEGTPTAGGACADEATTADLTVELAATPSLALLPETGQAPGTPERGSAGTLPLMLAGALALMALGVTGGMMWRSRRTP
jgi:hypothetical protein